MNRLGDLELRIKKKEIIVKKKKEIFFSRLGAKSYFSIKGFFFFFNFQILNLKRGLRLIILECNISYVAWIFFYKNFQIGKKKKIDNNVLLWIRQRVKGSSYAHDFVKRLKDSSRTRSRRIYLK